MLGQLGPNYGGMVFMWSPFRILSDDPGRQPRCPPLLKIENLAKYHLKVIASETAGSKGTKLWWNGLQMVPFQNYIRQPRPPKKMAAIAKNWRFPKIHLNIISSETDGPVGPKLLWNGH
jgi:hypothetical protein